VYIFLLNSCEKFHAKISCIAEISTKVTGAYFSFDQSVVFKAFFVLFLDWNFGILYTT